MEIPCCHLPPLPPTPPTLPPPGGGGNGGPPDEDYSKPSDPGPSDSTSPSAASTEAGGPWVIGLSDTSSREAQALFFLVGLAMIVYGIKLVGKEVFR